MSLPPLDWSALDRLRDGFLHGGAASGPYWQSASDLAAYDATFGERIGWKWDAVLAELRRRDWRPSARTVLDFGCGSGIAGRRVLAAFGVSTFDRLHVSDHSAHAEAFALARAHETFPGLPAATWRESDPVGLLVISHVLNELPPAARKHLVTLLDRAEAVLWVEPGTHAVSRDLAAWRDRLLPRFRVVAPCTHAAACGLFASENARHWCHFFADPPSAIFSDPDWVRFGQRAGIDLRGLPYSFLALEAASHASGGAPLPADAVRIIGRPEHFKGFARLLSCAVDGLGDLELQKRTDPALFKQLKRDPGQPPLYRWQRSANRITSAEALFPPA